ncbi:hypothetical protein [Streptomyces sp. ML-6]|nr:hypothetical protein [Streptomyces sp. ML-6]MDK0517586.1 hypothetical protein [Streptomyces sp. ML-6]
MSPARTAHGRDAGNPADTDEGGHSLYLVGRFAAPLGHPPPAQGKTIW